MSEPTRPDCRALSDPALPMTVFLGGQRYEVVANEAAGKMRGQWFACTQRPDHPGDHKACNGMGLVLARWPRRDGEQHWTPGACEGHSHG